MLQHWWVGLCAQQAGTMHPPRDSSRVPRNLAPRKQSSRCAGSRLTVGTATNSRSDLRWRSPSVRPGKRASAEPSILKQVQIEARVAERRTDAGCDLQKRRQFHTAGFDSPFQLAPNAG